MLFKQIVKRLLEQDNVISYEGGLKIDLTSGSGMVCAGPVCANTSVAAISRFVCLWFTMSCTMPMFGIATHFHCV